MTGKSSKGLTTYVEDAGSMAWLHGSNVCSCRQENGDKKATSAGEPNTLHKALALTGNFEELLLYLLWSEENMHQRLRYAKLLPKVPFKAASTSPMCPCGTKVEAAEAQLKDLVSTFYFCSFVGFEKQTTLILWCLRPGEQLEISRNIRSATCTEFRRTFSQRILQEMESKVAQLSATSARLEVEPGAKGTGLWKHHMSYAYPKYAMSSQIQGICTKSCRGTRTWPRTWKRARSTWKIFQHSSGLLTFWRLIFSCTGVLGGGHCAPEETSGAQRAMGKSVKQVGSGFISPHVVLRNVWEGKNIQISWIAVQVKFQEDETDLLNNIGSARKPSHESSCWPLTIRPWGFIKSQCAWQCASHWRCHSRVLIQK